MLPDNYKDIGIFKPYELCKILFNNTDQFLHMYNHLFIRHGSYIDEMYKIALIVNVEFWKLDSKDDTKCMEFFNTYGIYNEYSVKQYLEFKEIDDGKIRK